MVYRVELYGFVGILRCYEPFLNHIGIVMRCSTFIPTLVTTTGEMGRREHGLTEENSAEH